MRSILMLLSCSAILAWSHAERAENWPQFRGPNGSPIADGQNLPTEWGSEKNIHWKVQIPGSAWSCPITWGDRVFVTTAVSDDPRETPKKGLYFGGERPIPDKTTFGWDVLCLDADSGKILWQETAAQGVPKTPAHLKNTFASETPVTDGEHVYAYFGSAGLYCYNFDGDLVWSKDFGPIKTRFGWGTASSPVLDGDRLFIQCDNETQSFVAAFDKRTGEQLWRVDRDEVSSWSTPFLWHTAERKELVTCATKRVRSYDPATGNLLWEMGGMSTICSPTPVATPELLYVSSGYVLDTTKPLVAVRPNSSGTLMPTDQNDSAIAWHQKLAGPYIPSPIVYDDYIYVLYDLGFFACFDAKTGEEIYRERIERGSGGFSASPWAYDGKIFCLSEDGTTYVIQAGRDYKLLGKNSLDEMCMASPAAAGGSLFLRALDHLYCIRQPR